MFFGNNDIGKFHDEHKKLYPRIEPSLFSALVGNNDIIKFLVEDKEQFRSKDRAMIYFCILWK